MITVWKASAVVALVGAMTLTTESWAQGTSSSQVAAAKSIMADARDICKVFEESPHLVVQCPFEGYPSDKKIGFARAVANADAVLTGKARNIYFEYPSGKKWAQADRVSGIRLTE